LQKSERQRGFCEGTRDAPDLFFRNGKAEVWRDRLTARQAQAISRDHADVMRVFGYALR